MGKNLSLPPALECSPVFGATFRFDVTNALTSAVVSKANLMAVPGCMGAVVNTTGYTIASAIRIKRIRMWPAAGGECGVQWNGSAGKMRDESKDVTLPAGITVDRMVELTPPPNSYASMWWEAGESSVSIMQITSTSGAIIDLLLDFTLANVMSTSAVTFATISVGVMTYPPLDGNTTHIMKQLGRNASF